MNVLLPSVKDNLRRGWGKMFKFLESPSPRTHQSYSFIFFFSASFLLFFLLFFGGGQGQVRRRRGLLLRIRFRSPVVAQWVKGLMLSARMRVQTLALLSGLRILSCCEQWHRLQMQVGSGVAVASICCR